MTMSIRRMTLGAGYRYLMSSVARADEATKVAGLTGYYAATGTPPGWFLGAGLAGLAGGAGVEHGSLVTEEQLWRMLGMLQDPVTGEQLGRPPTGTGMVFVDHLGRVRKAKPSVAGFDLTFSVPKSVSVAWALADEPTRTRIHAAHRRALQAVIAYGESQVFATRTGHAGAISEDVRGVVATAFDHWDSRAGDPQLHTHVVVLNRVQSVVDGRWRTLDSKGLFRAAVGMSELYNGLLADELTRDLGWTWVPQERTRSTEPKWEVDGVGKVLREEFSRRSSVIERAKDELVEAFVASHGRQPSGREVIGLRQRATLATREAKQVKPLAELIQGWRFRARDFVGDDQPAWVVALAGRHAQKLVTAHDLGDGILAAAATLVVAKVADKRATFTRANLLAEVHRQLHGVRFATTVDRIDVAERTATLAADRAVMLTPAAALNVPEHLRRADGSSMLRARNSEVYATQELLDAEARLLAAGQSTDGPAVTTRVTARLGRMLVPGKEHVLSAEQVHAVAAVVTSGRRLDVLVGAAGTGKSTAMAGVRAAWEAEHGPGSVVGLAPSAASAEVLADAVGVPTENTAKWISENQRTPEREQRLQEYAARLSGAYPSVTTRQLQQRAAVARAAYARWTLRPGQLVIIDEASMAATKDLDHITAAATRTGAKVLLVGDWAQLSPVQAGGAFKLLADDRGADVATLHDVRRFRHEWERDATLHLRAGNPEVADTYLAHGRVESGAREDVLDLLFEAWLTDTRAGRRSLMIAADAQTVADLNARARAHRVAGGAVADGGVTTADGTDVGVGDVVVTRLNVRALSTGRGWVKNGDDWIVRETRDDGSVRLTRPDNGETANLPATYVAEHLELGYASTAHRAQGRTVDTAHAYVTATTTREPLYVMATRGRESNRMYVDTAHDPDDATRHSEPEHADPDEVLRNVIATTGAETSATQTRRAEAAAARTPWRTEGRDATGVALRDL
ncbi:TrwC relaxase [Phycicoccus sp. Root563]|uniref:MobF family relaxase n=1 Tax=Phycicoccus sp. Root563 TaxID=1736562 RepID=UPI000702544F|nr:MobF family relaxase [Phycicoccus sp. Root563]KQZ88455.1 TrwC relaxase [Phycicoccus sp. Root563]